MPDLLNFDLRQAPFQPFEVIARREFYPSYIILDSIFLLVFAYALFRQRKYTTLWVGIIMGWVYFLVDFGIFHLALHTRSISPGYSLAGVLFWMSMSYGFTNFVWIWLALSKDRHLIQWTVSILGWWLICPPLSRLLAGQTAPIRIERTTGSYHTGMLIMLVVGYGFLIVYNLLTKEKAQKVSLIWLNVIGICAQLGWELALLVGGIRSAGFASWQQKAQTLVINSLLETNLGMPYVFFLFALITARSGEDLQHRLPPLTVRERIVEINSIPGWIDRPVPVTKERQTPGY